ncbi:hypothetical protein PR001_g3794 [Phytophthora rubi]|uniref:Uncharacterized protein n=1 Tax=Phytophthora rubi TaxID=129364 RepID=A0A6A3NGU9_9STRA|nr:hypothetical protein PR002_g3839 [Phytophthora rubi]KAE9048470.1 hypothetical protein PR001_g3794 [Phytophthora rubi]
MGNVCTCCSWGRGGSGSKDAKAKKDAWFEQDSVPLVSAKHGPGDDDADGSLNRTVLIRSPRTTRASTSDIDESSNRQRTTRHIQQQHEDEERQYHVHRVKSASVDSSRYGRRSRRSEHADDEDRPRSRSKDRHRHSEDSDDRPRYERRTARSSSLEVQDSTRELRSASSESARSHRTTSHSQDAASYADDEVESVDSFHGSTRSHRSSSASSSPKASSRSGSPKKKPRYGRKHYRANANRK